MARSRKSITLGTQTLHGVDRFGEWFTTGVEGWSEPPAPKSSDVEREQADGDYWLPAYYSARTPTIDGILLGASHQMALDGMVALNRAAALGGTTLAIMEGGSSTWARARYAGLDYTWVTHEKVRYQLRLKCPDPRKFGEQRKFVATPGSDAKAYHRGNYPAKPVVTISGSMPGGYRLGVGGLAFVITRPLLSGTPHVVDYNDGRLRINGLVVHGNVAESFTPGIQPGTPTVVSLTATTTGTGSASFAVTDTYI